MFDIAKLDTATDADPGKVMEVVNPATGQIVLNEDGTPVFIRLRGRNSATVRAAQRKIQNRRLEAMRRGKSKITAEDMDNEGVDLLTAATVDWNFFLDGAEYLPTEANAREFWSDPRFKAIREQADTFIGDEGNFIKG